MDNNVFRLYIALVTSNWLLTEGTFYEEELQKVKRADVFRIEKVLKKHTKNKKTEYLVHWCGYGPDFDSWIQSSDIEPISENEQK